MTMGIASLKEGSGCAVQCVEICTRTLDLVKVYSSANDEATYWILVLVEDKRSSPVELNGMANSISMLVRSWYDVRRMREVEDGRMCAVSVL